MTLTKLRQRDCRLDEDTHKYFWNPGGQNIEMAISVTGVINLFSPYNGPPEAGWRGTHIHRCMEALAKGTAMPDVVSPEGIDCSDWFAQLQGMSLWNEVDVLASELVMTRREWSLGGTLDLLVRKNEKTILIDLKTKSAKWRDPWPGDVEKYKAQAGAYFMLLNSGDDGGPVWVDHYRTLIVKPDEVVWLPEMDGVACSTEWSNSWLTYLAHKQVNPF